MGRPHQPIFQASLVLTAIGPVHSDWPKTSKMWMLRDAKYSRVCQAGVYAHTREECSQSRDRSIEIALVVKTEPPPAACRG